MDFKKAEDLLKLCESKGMTISEVMKRRECDQFDTTEDEIVYKMQHAWKIMKESAVGPTKNAVRSMGGLIGGEAKKLNEHRAKGKSIVGNVMAKAITYAMAVLEVNASMGLIVAAPTAGSSGVVPGVLLALQEEYKISDDRIIDGLFNASAIGYLAMQNATVAGAVGGCQAEIGVAAAMAASAATELMGGDARQCMYAASTVLMNMLGLICDPVLGLVEYPCQNRNASGAANALIAAEMSLSGITQMIPLDEMMDCMYNVGRRMPVEFRETAKGGCAATPTACALCKKCS
ncbi:MAG: L-serine ammonia-lyase, iron-sulfur-dependent, subunit alpha [Lachnospiraceae bacterium]|nr:L-serine ammonia-lyase, iron-sulfur-dependent, subunit alpha [Lachnospiraceae bacterium]